MVVLVGEWIIGSRVRRIWQKRGLGVESGLRVEMVDTGLSSFRAPLFAIQLILIL